MTYSKRRYTFDNVNLYFVVSFEGSADKYCEVVKKACLGGVDIVQFRNKQMPAARQVEVCSRLNEICHRFGSLFVVNDRVDIAVACGADGVHLGQEDLSVVAARNILGHYKIIGKSTHSLTEAKEASDEGADYISCGPVWKTPTKPEYNAVGLDLVSEYKKKVKIPFFAIGGINLSNIDEVIKCGAEKVVVVRALGDAGNIKSAAEEFSKRIKERLWKKKRHN